jgi:cell fate regulator YaaT (PSP1 superfamily)
MNIVRVILDEGKSLLADSGSMELTRGDLVMVRAGESLGVGTVMGHPCRLPGEVDLQRIKPVERLATLEDLDQVNKNRRQEKRAFNFALKRIEVRQLPIHLVRVECLFDASKIIFYFTAPGRVDFRELVKDLVQEFRTRIELRQIGVRHRAKMVGGLGVCGRALCCASFLRDFEPVSVRMAKQQQITLNPSKVSGICGRLMCCLTYEYSTYQEIKKHLPRVGKKVNLAEGQGKIMRYNVIRQTVTVDLGEGQEMEVAIKDLVQAALDTPEGGGEGSN